MEQQNFFKEAKSAIEQYIKDRLLLVKLQAVEKISQGIASAVFVVLLLFFGFFMWLFLNITAGFFFGYLLGNTFWGFAIVTGFYLLLIIILLISRKALAKSITNTVIKSFFGKKDKQNDNQSTTSNTE
jgi:hypothetical protein